MNVAIARSSGLLLMIAGVLFGSFMFFHPPNTPQGALEGIWVPVHLMWLIAYLLIICSLIPLFPLAVSQGLLATISYWLSFIGTALSLPIAVWDAFIVPYLAKHAPDLILQIEELSFETPVLTFRIIFFITVLIFSLGFILYGISLIRSRLVPVMVGVCFILGAPLFWVGALFISNGSLGNRVTEIGASLFGIGLVMYGLSLFSNISTQAALQGMKQK